MRARFAAVALGACSLACGPEPLVVQVPFEAADESAVVAVVRAGGADLWAVDASVRQMQPILQSVDDWDGEARFEIHAAFYSTPLATQGLSPGRVQSVPEGGQALPAATRMLSADLGAGTPTRWTAVTARPPALDEIRIPRDSPCRRYVADPDWIRYSSRTTIRGLVRGPAGAPWLVRTEAPDGDLTLERVAADGTIAEVLRPELAEGFRVRAAAPGSNGEVWLGGGSYGGFMAIFAGPPRGPFREVVHADVPLSREWPRAIAAPRHGEAEDTVYYLSTQGVLHRVRGETNDTLTTLPAPDPTRSNRGGLTWHAPGELYVVPPRGDAIVRVVDGVATTEALGDVPPLETDPVETVVSVPGFGLFAGLDSGYLLAREGEAWTTRVENQLVQSSIETMVAFEDGMLVAGRYGIVDQYYRSTGYCVSDRVFVGSSTLEEVLVQPEGILVAGTEPDPGGPNPWFATWVRRIDPGGE